MRIPLVRPVLPPLTEFATAIEPVWESRMLSNFGPQARRFEQLATTYAGVAHGRAVATCDIGLTLAVKALDIPPGAEAVVPSFTFNSTLHALLWNGLRPRFVDIDAETYGVNAEIVASALTDQTALVVGTHVFGVPCDVTGIEALCRARGIPCLFDAAQAFGTWMSDRHIGRFGDASAFSFSGTKVTTCAEGGLVTFQEARPAERFGLARGYGFETDYISGVVGLNGKLSELHATLGVLTVPSTEKMVARRMARDRLYRQMLADAVGFQRVPGGVRPSYTYMPVDLGPQRDAVAEELARAGIQTKAYFRPLHLMPLFAHMSRETLTVTERVAASVLCLPLHPDIDEIEIEEVATRVRATIGA